MPSPPRKFGVARPPPAYAPGDLHPASIRSSITDYGSEPEDQRKGDASEYASDEESPVRGTMDKFHDLVNAFSLGQHEEDDLTIDRALRRPRRLLDSDELDLEDDDGVDEAELEDAVMPGTPPAPTEAVSTKKPLSYKDRLKQAKKQRIVTHQSSLYHRQEYLRVLAKALLQFGAPSHRVESLLRTAAAVIDVDAEFLCLPAVIVVGFGKHDGWKVNTHWIKSDSVIGLSALHDVHHIYRQVIHDKMSAETAREELIRIIRAPPLYGIWVRDALAFLLSALICPLAFGGSFIDLWIAGAGAALLNHVRASIGSPGYVVVFELFIAMFTSFVARALGSINPQAPIFCYNAISSSSILSILPGFLILTAALELASKQMTTGGVKMVFALMYTLLLGFGLSIGSDLYLLFDSKARHYLDSIAVTLETDLDLTGMIRAKDGHFFIHPLIGQFSLGDVLHDSRTENIIKSCLRLESAPWYRQPFPTWTQFLIVPAFSITSSFAHGQKWQSREFVVMILISCAAYACNALANAHMHSRSDFVAAIGGLAVGFLGNTYSRLSNFFFRNRQGTAFNVMVVGILFMVPSGLSETGGLTARGSAVDIGGAMIGVSVGITVGLFIANAVVYAFGRKKTGASFSM